MKLAHRNHSLSCGGRIGCEFELEVPRDLGRHLRRQRETARRVEGEKIVDRLDHDEPRLPRAAERHVFFEEAAHLRRARRDPGDIVQSQLLPDLVQRIARTLAERLGRDGLTRLPARRVLIFGPGRAQRLQAPFDPRIRMTPANDQPVEPANQIARAAGQALRAALGIFDRIADA